MGQIEHNVPYAGIVLSGVGRVHLRVDHALRVTNIHVSNVLCM